VREVPTGETGIIKAVELPGHEQYFLLMKSTSLKRQHKRTLSNRLIKEKIFYSSFQAFAVLTPGKYPEDNLSFKIFYVSPKLFLRYT
jgi:hypothetical protein